MKKRLLSAAMALSLCLTLLPTAAFAAVDERPAGTDGPIRHCENEKGATREERKYVFAEDCPTAAYAGGVALNAVVSYGAEAKKPAPTNVEALFEVPYDDTSVHTVKISDFNLPEDIKNPNFEGNPSSDGGNGVLDNFTMSGFYLKDGLGPDDGEDYWTVVIKSNNYEDITAKVTVRVVERAADTTTLQLFLEGWTYGDAANVPRVEGRPDSAGVVSYTYEGREGTTYPTSSDAPKGAGSYIVRAKCSDASKTYIAECPFLISPRTLTAAMVGELQQETYNGNRHCPTPEVKDKNTLEENKEYTLEYDENINVASGGKVTVKGIGNYTGTIERSFDILPLNITPTVTVSGSYTYDRGNEIVPTYTVKNGDTDLQSTDYTATLTDNVDAGVGKLIVSPAEKGNYDFEAVERDFKIDKAVITTPFRRVVYQQRSLPQTFCEIADVTEGVDLPIGVKASEYVKGVIVESSGTIQMDADSGYYLDGKKLTCILSGGDVGDTITVSVRVISPNYDGIVIDTVITLTDKEAQAALEIVGESETLYGDGLTLGTKGGTTKKPVTWEIAAGGENADVSASGVLTPKKSGTVTVRATMPGDDKFNDVAALKTIQIKKRPISVEAVPKSMTAGGSLPKFDVVYRNLPTGVKAEDIFEALAAASTVTDGKAAGNFLITVAAPVLKTGMEDKYEIGALTNATLTVTEAAPAPSGGGGGGGGGGAATYPVESEKTSHGTVRTEPRSAAAGETVTITATPDAGWHLADITAWDKDGKKISLTAKNGQWTFHQPESKVTVEARFAFFRDVAAQAYYETAVAWAVERGITDGVTEELFMPDQPCTRAQIVTFLWRAAESPEPKSTAAFTDVPADAYYAKAVAWAMEQGITTGTDSDRFDPDGTCTRAQSAAFLYRAAGSPAVAGSSAFADVDAEAYYAAAVEWAANQGISLGLEDGSFGPGLTCTRAQIVTFLYRAYADK